MLSRKRRRREAGVGDDLILRALDGANGEEVCCSRLVLNPRRMFYTMKAV